MFLGEASMLWNFNSVNLGFKQQYMPQLCSFRARVHLHIIHCHLVCVSGIFYTPGLSLCFVYCLQVSQVKVCSSSDDHYWYFHGNHCICSTSGEYIYTVLWIKYYVLASVVNLKKKIYFPRAMVSLMKSLTWMMEVKSLIRESMIYSPWCQVSRILIL